MIQTKVLALTAILCALAAGCGEDVEDDPPNPCDQQQPTGAVGDGDHEIEVTQPDGSVDTIWIHAVSPKDGAGPFPVLVFAKGQDNFNTFNCSPDGPAPVDTALAESFAGLGFLTVMVSFRDQSNHAPGVGTLRPRDHYLLDTRAFLAAARWAWLEHGKGSRHMAFIGHGLGTLPAMWAATAKMPQLDDLQSCLAPRTMILAGGSANLIDWNNVTDEYYAVTDLDIKLRMNLLGLESLLLHTTAAQARSLAMSAETYSVPDVIVSDLDVGPLADLLFQDVEVPGLSLLKKLGFQAAPADTGLHPQCATIQGLPPLCLMECAERVTHFDVNFEPWIGDLSHWASEHGSGSIGWWEPPAKTAPADPDLSTSVLLRSLHDASPVYMAQAMHTKRALHMLSSGDQNNRPEAQQLLVDKLTSLGVTIASPPVSDPGGAACGAGDYFSVPRSGCGWVHLVTELTDAFPQ